MKASILALLACASAFAVVPFACADNNEFMGVDPPSGAGGRWDPGDGSKANGTGTGTGTGYYTGTGGSGGGGPPMCDDSLKRCDHLFTYQDMGDTTVEIHGDFDAWGPGVPMTKSGSTWSATVKIPYNVDVLYKFVVDGKWIPDPANPDKVPDGFNGFNSRLLGATCDPFTCDAPKLGDWPDAVLYFVFVDRFHDGNPGNNGQPTPGVQKPADYQGGDWAGVLQKIQSGYFTDLGVNALWLSVPMDNTEQSGQGQGGDPHQYSAYHGYWPKDLDNPEEHFGSFADLKAVVDEAHKQNIKVIFDYAMNHVHVSSPLYAQHMNDGWFWPIDMGGQSCICGSAACSWDGATGKRCWFTSYLPDFNFNNKAARDYSVNNAITWIKNTGADGFRLDAVKHIEDQWILDLRARVTSEIEPASMKHFYMVGETFTGDTNLLKYYVNPSKMLDGQFDFPFRVALVSAVLNRTKKMAGGVDSLDDFMTKNETRYSPGLMSTFIGNHDVPRAINFAQDAPAWSNPWDDGKAVAWSNQPGLPGGTSAFERLANAFAVLLTTPGVPLIYYGDEIGLPGGGDPDNRRMMPWINYSQGQQLLLSRVKALTKIRAGHVALRRGKRTSLGGDDNTLAYKMVSGGDIVYVAINRDDMPRPVGNLPAGVLTDQISGSMVTGPSVTIPPRSTMVLTQ